MHLVNRNSGRGLTCKPQNDKIMEKSIDSCQTSESIIFKKLKVEVSICNQNLYYFKCYQHSHVR